MTGCLDDNEASEFASGSLPGDATTRVESHLAGCRDCRSLVAALAPAPGDADADSDIITSPRKAALGKKGKRTEIAIAPTERPTPPGGREPTTRPDRPRRQDPVIAAGDTIGRYIVLARLGAGGMGVVYTAYDPQLDRKVALKLLRTLAGVGDDEARSRLVREAQAIAQLSHPNVVAVYDVGTADSGEVYVAMELVEGETLSSWLGHWDRTWRDILELFFQAGRGLAAAHARGLMHRDFKPDNVLVGTDGRVRVTDFGLARSLIDQVDELVRDRPRPDLEALRVTLTATGTVLGTPRYMAPEQLRGADADARSDQFSFCVALYEALYDRHPLVGDSVIEMVQHGSPPEAPPVDTKVPSVIGRTIMRGLSPEPNRRFPSMAALLVELTPPPLHAGRRGWMAALGAVALVAGGAAAAMVAQGDAQTTAPGDPDVQSEIDKLRSERDEYKRRIDELMYADGGLAARVAEIEILQEEIAERDRRIEQLAAQVPPDAGPRPVRRPPAPDAAPPQPRGLSEAQLAAAVAAKRDSIASCLQEWSERNPDEGATVLVTFSVAPDGTVLSKGHRGLDDTQTPTCITNAVGRAEFPRSAANTRGETTVVLEAGEIRVTTRLLGTSAPGQTIDFDRGYPGASGR